MYYVLLYLLILYIMNSKCIVHTPSILTGELGSWAISVLALLGWGIGNFQNNFGEP